MKSITQFVNHLKKENELKSGDFNKLLVQFVEKQLKAQFVFYFEKEDLLEEVRFIFGNQAAMKVENDQYFYHFKDLAFKNLSSEPAITQGINRHVPKASFHSTLFFPIELTGDNPGILVLANPADKQDMEESGLQFLKELFKELNPILRELRLKTSLDSARKEIELINRITQIVDMSNITSFFFQALIELIVETVDCQIVIFLMYNEEKGSYYLEAGNEAGREFWVSQTEFFRSLAQEAQTRGTFSESYGGKYFKGEKYGLDRLETALSLPLDFYHKSVGVFILLNKNHQNNFGRMDVKLMQIISGYTKAIIYRELEKNDLVQLFRRFVSNDIASQLLENQGYGMSLEDKQEITVIFIDLNGFTTFAENTAPSTVTRQLNSYFQEMTNLIDEYEGTLDKYLGDGIMALFGAPNPIDNHAERAVECALAMQERMSEMTQIWVEEGMTPLTASVGVCTGEAMVGAVGCDKFMDYTAIGDTINVASRLCDLAGNGTIMISEYTWNLMQDVIDCEKVDKLKVKGKQMAVNAYEVHGMRNIYEVRDLLRSGEDKVRFRILRALGRFEAYREFDAVLDYIDHVNPEIRLAAIETVGRLNRERHLPRVIEYLDLEKVQKIRQRILTTISKISIDPLNPLIQKFIKGLAPGVKPTVLKATVNSPNRDDRRLFLALVKAFQDRDEARSTMLADLTNCLYQEEDREIMPLLLELLPKTNAKGKIAIIASLAKLDVPQIARPLVQTLDEENEFEVLMGVSKAFGKLSNLKTIKVIAHLCLESNRSKHWYKYFVCRQKPGTIEPFQQLLEDSDEFLLFGALTYLGVVDIRPVAKDLLNLLDRTDKPYIQQKIIENLKFMPPEEVMPRFMKHLHRSETLSQAILSEIGFRKQTQYLDKVHAFLDSTDPMTQMAAVSAAGKMAHPDSLPLLLELLDNQENANLSATIMNNLGNFHSSLTIEPLMEALYSPIGRIRANAIESLMVMHHVDAAPSIERLLGDDNNRVRANAALASIRFGKVQAFGVLTDMAKSPNKWMRLSCLWALSAIKLPESRNVIFGMLKDSDYDVVLSAVQFLKRLH